MHEQRHVVLAVAQRRQLDRDDVQPVEQIFAELALFHHLAEIDVGRRDDPDVHLDRLHAAEAHEVALLDDAQQLRLRLERDVADFVEEDAPLVGEIEHPLLGIDGAGEGALDVAEQRRLEEIRRKISGVDRDERSIRSRRVRVDRARDEFLAGPALALDENRRAARCRLDDQIEDLPHLRALADDVRELVVPLLDVLPQVAVLVHEPPPLHRVAHDDEHFVVLERLGDVVEGAGLHRRDRALDRRVGGDDDDVEVFVDPLQLVERGDAVEPRHHDVDDRRVERQRARELEPFGARGREADVVALARQQRLENLAHDLFIVDDENRAAS